MGRSTRNTKKKGTNNENYKIFLQGLQSQYEKQKKSLLSRKAELEMQINQQCELAKHRIPPEILNMKWEDVLKLSDLRNKEPQQRPKNSVEQLIAKDGTSSTFGDKFQVPSGLSSIGSKCTPSSQFNKRYTSKIDNVSVTMLRIPEHGELALSSTGSPLLVSTSARDNSVTANIPLKNGKKMVLLPHPEVDTDSIKSSLDESVKSQLQTLVKTLHELLE